ncbi:MAG TPA: PH domain-containing protein, partial [Patescibacteria group bacterium]|nr:PH domain-containing protein [Patescibacteria group bacterium]
IKLIVIFSYNAFLITNQRVMLFKQVGLFERSVSETDYGKIQDISYRIKGLGQTLFRYGSIRLQIMGSESPIIVSKIPKPREVQQLILKIKNHEEVG